MNVLKIRNEMRSGKSIFDLPLRVTFYARVIHRQRRAVEQPGKPSAELYRTDPIPAELDLYSGLY